MTSQRSPGLQSRLLQACAMRHLGVVPGFIVKTKNQS